jgi:hypothetical protein
LAHEGFVGVAIRPGTLQPLQEEHLRVWYASAHTAGGKKLHEQIEDAIRSYDRLLLVLSSDRMASEWVKTEISTAGRREIKEGHRILLPISIVPFEDIRSWEYFDADAGKDLAKEVREYFIPDFSNWRDDAAFEKAFSRLLRDLQAREPDQK